MGMFSTHIGSWGTPDFGVTEKIGSWLSKPTNYQGGSEVFGAPAQPQAASYQPNSSQINYSPAGSGLGKSTSTSSYRAPTNNNQQVNNPNPNNNNNNQQPQSDGRQDWLNSINSEFDSLLGGLGGQQESDLNYARQNADTQRTGINQQLGYGVDNLNLQRDSVRENQAKTLADLSMSLRDSSRNVGNMLGARGANGSAQDASSYALTKLFGNQRAGVMQQTGGQMNEIATVENNLKASAAGMLNDVDTWFNSTSQSIVGKYNDLRNNIGSMKAGARLDAIAQLEGELRSAQQRRQEISQSIQESARTRLQQLNDYKTQLSGQSQFTPEQQVYNEYSFDPGDYQADAGFDYNPLALAKKKREQGLV